MLVPNQKVEVKWNNKTKAWYINKGYNFTKKNDTFLCNVEDLPKTSMVRVNVTCDGKDCNIIYDIPYMNYTKSINKYGKYFCKSCAVKYGKNKERIRNIHGRYLKFVDWCNKNNYEAISDESDCQKFDSLLYYKCPKHGIKSIQCENIHMDRRGKCCFSREQNILSPENVLEIIESNGSKLNNPNEYIGCNVSNLNITCPLCNNDYTTSLALYKATSGYCPECGTKQSQKNRIKNLAKLKYAKYSEKCKLLGYSETLSEENFLDIFSSDTISFICDKHGYVEQSFLHFVNDNSICYECAKENMASFHRLSPTTVSNIISSKNNNKLLNPNDYIKNDEKNLQVLCGNCNRVFYTSLVIYNNNITGKCPDCNERSIGEYLISIILDKYNVFYKRQMPFEECKDKKFLPFDFYLPDYNLCIEYDGEGHYEPCFGEESYFNTITHDAMKNWFCKWNDIGLLRIPYWERNNLESILIEKLNLPQIVEIKLSNNKIFKYKTHKLNN